jgi:hypothetical protein
LTGIVLIASCRCRVSNSSTENPARSPKEPQRPDAQKGLGFVPDYQALTAWDEAEQKRRQT